MESAISAWVADKCDRVPGQELSEVEEAAHAHLVREAEGKEPGAWDSFGVSERLTAGDSGKSAVDTRWVLS